MTPYPTQPAGSDGAEAPGGGEGGRPGRVRVLVVEDD
ncbi:two-component system response regulator, partial [Streptomyces sp. SM8]